MRLSKERPNCTDRHVYGGHVERLEHVAAHVFSTCLGVQRNIREQYRTFLGRASILTEYLRNVGDTTLKTSLVWANAVNSLVIPVVRLEAHRDKSVWFATYMTGTTSVSTICVTRSSYTGFVVFFLPGPHQLEYTEADRMDPPLLTENFRTGGSPP